MSNTTATTMKTKNTYSVNIVYKDGSLSTIGVDAYGIGWISHEVEKALGITYPLDFDIIRIEKIK